MYYMSYIYARFLFTCNHTFIYMFNINAHPSNVPSQFPIIKFQEKVNAKSV